LNGGRLSTPAGREARTGRTPCPAIRASRRLDRIVPSPKAATSNVIAIIIAIPATKAHTVSLARFVFVSWIRRTRSQNHAEKPCSTAHLGVLLDTARFSAGRRAHPRVAAPAERTGRDSRGIDIQTDEQGIPLPHFGAILDPEVMLQGEDLVRKSEAEMRRVRGRRISMILRNAESRREGEDRGSGLLGARAFRQGAEDDADDQAFGRDSPRRPVGSS